MKRKLWQRAIRRARKTYTNWMRGRLEPWLVDYFQANQLQELLTMARERSSSTGADLWDYMILHETIKRLRPNSCLNAGQV